MCGLMYLRVFKKKQIVYIVREASPFRFKWKPSKVTSCNVKLSYFPCHKVTSRDTKLLHLVCFFSAERSNFVPLRGLSMYD
jgi:hypothetical protein